MHNKNRLTLFVRIHILFICMWVSGFLSAQNVADKYNLSFNYGDSIDFEWRMVMSPFMEIDSTKLINGKYPLLVKQHPAENKFIPYKYPLAIAMHQKLPVPSNREDTAKVILSYKAANLKSGILKSICIADGGYSGQPIIDWVKQQFSWRLEIIKRNEQAEFKVLPKRWIVKRTLAWISYSRRSAKDYEKQTDTSQTMTQLTMIRIFINRI